MGTVYHQNISYSGTKGDTGETPVISATANVDSGTGTPSVNVTKSGTDENPSFDFAFSNLKGAKGDKGDTGTTDAEILIRDTVGWTGKNELNVTRASGSDGNLVYTINADKSITVSGSHVSAYVLPLSSNDVYVPNVYKGHKLTGCTNGSSSTYGLYIAYSNNGTSWANQAFQYDSEYTVRSDYDYVKFGIWFVANTSLSSPVTFYPMLRKADITDSTYEPYHETVEYSKFDRSEQRVLGAKNLNNSHYVTTTDKGITYTANSDGSISVAGTATADSYNNSDSARRFEAPFTGQVILSGGASGGVYLYPYDYTLGSRPYIDSSLTTKQTGDITTSDGELSFYMQEGHSLLINMRVLNGTAISSAVTLKPMLRLASDPDDTYAPYAMTNKELTDIVKNVPQEIVRTGVTATAGTAVRIPASGTDSRISTANTCVVKPIADAKSDGTPYKYRSCKVYSGYVEITYAENISNIAVGVEVVNY